MEFMVSYQLFNGLCGNICRPTLELAEECARLNWGTCQSISIFSYQSGLPLADLTLVRKVK